MRNLKKILALALALVMTLSVMTVANAAFTDSKDVNETYAEAVEVLAGLKVFKGTGNGTTFSPKQEITRAEVAAIIYRIVTGDVTDAQAGIYADYAKFADVNTKAWYAGYVGYCANAELIKGDGKNFYPMTKVTGYQALAMILRAVGYDVNGEFTGTGWEVRVASTAQDLGILENIVTGTLGVNATRETVAEILFQTIAFVPTVTYTPALGYNQYTSVLGGVKNATLGAKTFGLSKGGATSDAWGRPCYKWSATKPAAVAGVVATIAEKATKTYTTATTECQIASDIGLNANTTFTLYTNGSVNETKYIVQPTDTVQALGAQGTLVEVYKDSKVIVVIDTFLAEVLNVTPAVYDAAGHKISNATISLHVYTTGVTTKTGVTTNLVLTNAAADYTYNKGDMILINAYTNNTVNANTGSVTVNTSTSAGLKVTTGNNAAYAEILGLAKTMVGAQTFNWWNSEKHTIDGVNYDDAAWFMLDEAGTEVINHTWYFDNYGNLIGATNIATVYNYGIIEKIQWINPTYEVGYAKATIRYMDNTTAEAIVASVDGKTVTYADNGAAGTFAGSDAKVSTVLQYNADIVGQDLYRISTNPTGTLALEHVFTDSVSGPNGHNYTWTGTGSSATWALDSGENNHIANAAINPHGNGKDALSAITNGTTTIYVNANTVFMVRTVNADSSITYSVVTGYQNMPKYTTSTVDYVNLDGDSYADYVYVTGTPAAAEPYYGLFFLTSIQDIQVVLNANDTADYYVVSGILDGVAGSYKISATAVYDTFANRESGSVISRANVEGLLYDMAVVRVAGDKINWVKNTQITNSNDLHADIPVVAYTNLAMDYHAATTTSNAVTKTGEVLYVDGTYYTINGMTAPVFGTWNEGDMSGKTVYVIYDTTKTVTVSGGNSAFVATAVYVIDTAANGSNSAVGSAWATAVVTGYTYNASTSQVHCTTGASTTLSAMAAAWNAQGYTLRYNGYAVSASGNSMIIDYALANGTLELVETATNATWTVV